MRDQKIVDGIGASVSGSKARRKKPRLCLTGGFTVMVEEAGGVERKGEARNVKLESEGR